MHRQTSGQIICRVFFGFRHFILLAELLVTNCQHSIMIMCNSLNQICAEYQSLLLCLRLSRYHQRYELVPGTSGRGWPLTAVPCVAPGLPLCPMPFPLCCTVHLHAHSCLSPPLHVMHPRFILPCSHRPAPVLLPSCAHQSATLKHLRCGGRGGHGSAEKRAEQ